MRRRKPTKLDAVVQVNLRVDEQLRRQLERAAEEHRLDFSKEVRARLAGSFDKAVQSLASFRADWTRKARDAIERSAPKTEIEATLRRLRDLEVKWAGFYADVEELLVLDLRRDPKVRELVRGASQEQEKGGKA